MDDVRLVDLLPNSPFRPADWRWRLAGYLRDRRVRRVPRPWVRDLWVRRLRRFQAELPRCGSDRARLALARRWPGLFEAWRLWSGGGTPIVAEVQARILAAQNDIEIGGLLALAPATIGAYEAAFFDVRARLAAKSYILHQVVGPQIHQGLDPGDFHTLWQLAGFCGGPVLLNAVMAGFDGAHRPERFEQLAEFFRTDAQTTLWRRIWLAAKSLNPTDSRTQLQLLKLLPSLQEAGTTTAHRRPYYEAVVHHLADSTAPVLAAAQNPAEHQLTTSPNATINPSDVTATIDHAPVPLPAAQKPPHRSGQRTPKSRRRRATLPAAAAG